MVHLLVATLPGTMLVCCASFGEDFIYLLNNLYPQSGAGTHNLRSRIMPHHLSRPGAPHSVFFISFFLTQSCCYPHFPNEEAEARRVPGMVPGHTARKARPENTAQLFCAFQATGLW